MCERKLSLSRPFDQDCESCIFCFSWTEVIKSAVDELKKRKGSGLDRNRAGSVPSSAIGPAYGS